MFANAGIHHPAPLEAITEADIDATFGINVKGVVFTVQKALPLIGRGGVIVLNGSIAASKAYPNQALYNASKAAVRSLARSRTSDLKDRGIRVAGHELFVDGGVAAV